MFSHSDKFPEHTGTDPYMMTDTNSHVHPQLFIDSFLAKGWASKYERSQQLEEKYKLQLMELDEIEREEAEISAALARQPGGSQGQFSAISVISQPMASVPSFSRLGATVELSANDRSRLLDGVESSNGNGGAR